MNGVAMGAQGRSLLLSAVDTTGRPIFMPSANDGIVGRVLGSDVYFNRGLYVAGTSPAANIVGIAGDWSKAIFGTVAGVEISFTDTASLTVGSGESASTINLWQQNMVAIRAEIEVGFRADTACFNLLKDA
jgi:HK97 family phage major capsid protein